VNLLIAAPLIVGLGIEALGRSMTATIAAADLLPRLALANITLAAFNLLPAFPMDGGRALRALLAMRISRTKATRIAARAGHALALVFALVGLASGNAILIFIGLFVYVGASTEAYDVELHDIAARLGVSDGMVVGLAPLGPESLLAEAVSLLVSTTQQEFPVLDEEGRMLGLLTRDGLVRGLRSHGESLPVREAMATDVPTVGSERPLADALRLIQERSAPAVAVTDAGGRFVGLVTLENLNELMLVRSAVRRDASTQRPASAERLPARP
jgi:stage IV sporulation protein FB